MKLRKMLPFLAGLFAGPAQALKEVHEVKPEPIGWGPTPEAPSYHMTASGAPDRFFRRRNQRQRRRDARRRAASGDRFAFAG